MLSKNLSKGRPYVFLSAIAAYLLSAFYPSPFLHGVISVLSILIILMVFPFVPRFVQGLSALFLLIGGACCWQVVLRGHSLSRALATC